MERLELDDQEVALRRDELLAAYASVPEVYEPEDHPARTELCPGSDLKLFDDVEVADGGKWRVIAPGIGRYRVTVCGMGPFGFTITNSRIQDVVDRAPADPEETPMPVLGTVDPEAPDTPPEWVGGTPYPPTDPLPGPAGPTIPELRQQAFGKIDQCSRALIAVGFDYAGIRFSASLEAQVRFTNMMMLADMLAPIDVNSLDDTAVLTLELPDDLRSFCTTALFHIKKQVDDGGAQKKLVREMTTAEEILAFEDPRAMPETVFP